MPRVRHPHRVGLHIRVVLGDGAVVGPGRAELLEQVRDSGSVSAAARAMGMSYKRAWELAEALNAEFGQALIRLARGGAGGGGACITDVGTSVLQRYRDVERKAAAAVAAEMVELRGLRRRRSPDQAASDA